MGAKEGEMATLMGFALGGGLGFGLNQLVECRTWFGRITTGLMCLVIAATMVLNMVMAGRFS